MSIIKKSAVLISMVCISLLGGELLAQSPKLNLSPEFKLGKNRTFEAHLDSDAEGHYLYFYERKRQNTSVVVAKYDNNFKEIWNYEYLPDIDRTTTYGLKAVEDRFIWMFVEQPKRTKRAYFLAAIDKKGEVSKKVEVNALGFKKPSDEPIVDWTVSEDSTMVSVVQVFDKDAVSYTHLTLPTKA